LDEKGSETNSDEVVSLWRKRSAADQYEFNFATEKSPDNEIININIENHKYLRRPFLGVKNVICHFTAPKTLE
jgi:hypothetical protein